MAQGILGSMSVRLGADISDFQKKMRQVNRDFAGVIKAGESMRDVGSSLSKYVSAPLGILAGVSLKSSASLEQLKNGLVATTGSAKEAEKQLKRLNVIAKLPGLSLEQAVKGSIALQASGFSAAEAERNIKAFGNALSAAGRGSADLEGVTLALGQIQSKGKLSQEEINQLAERVPQIRKAMEAAFGTGDPMKLQKMGIDTKSFVAGVVTELEKIKPVAGGLANSFENFSDSSKNALAKLGDAINKTFDVSGTLSSFADKLSGLAASFENLSPTAQKTIVVIGAMAAAIGPLLVAVGTLGAALPSLAVGFAALTGPIGLVTIALAAAVGGLVYFIATAKTMKELEMGAVNKAMQDYMKIVGEPKSLQEFSEAQAFLNDKINQFEVGLTKAQAKLKSIKADQANAGVLNLTGRNFRTEIEKQNLVINAFKREIAGAGNALEQVKAQQIAFKTGTVQTASALQSQEGVLAKLRAQLAQLNIDQAAASEAQLPRINNEMLRVQALIKKYEELGLANKNGFLKASDIGGPLKTPDLIDEKKAGLGTINTDPTAMAEMQAKADGMLARLRSSIGTIKGEVIEMTSFMQQAIGGAFVSLGETIGAALSGSGGGVSGFFKGLLGIVLDFTGQFGKLLIGAGIAALNFKNLIVNPVGAIAAGVALVAISGAVKGLLSKGPQGGSGGYSSPPTATAKAASFSNGGSNIQVTGETRIVGSDIVIAYSRAQENNGRGVR